MSGFVFLSGLQPSHFLFAACCSRTAHGSRGAHSLIVPPSRLREAKA